MRPSYLIGILLLFVVVVAGAVGGSHLALDHHLVLRSSLWWRENPQLAGLIVWLTHLGGSFILLPLTLATAALLCWIGRKREALLLLGATISGRILIEVIKWSVDRPRPSFEPYPVYVSSQSFPSGHAGNSMITYTALALFALPERWRGTGLFAGVMLTLAIGSTRPMLGVHWPTDVVAGWALGALWVGFWWRVSQRPSG